MAITKEVNIVVKESGVDKVNQQMDNLAKSLKNADNEATNLDATFEEIYGDLKPLTARMGEAEDRLYELGLAGKQTSKEYQDLLKQVGDYRKVQIQTDLAVDAAASNLSQNLTGALGAVTGGFSVAQGAMGAFGVTSETTEEALLKVQSAMAISSGFETIKQGAKSFDGLKASIMATTFAQKTNTAATAFALTVQKLFTGSLTATSVGFKVLRGAIIATGIGALIVGVGLVVANFDKFKKVLSNIGWLTAVGDAISDIVNSVTDFLGFTSESERVLDKQKQVAEKSLKQNESYLKKNEHKLSEARKREIELSNEHFQRIVDGEMTKEESLKILREKANIDKNKAQEEQNKLEAEKQKEASEKAKEAEQKRIDDEKERVEKILDARKEELQKFNDLEKEFEQQREDERIKKLIAEDESKKNVTKGLESALQARKNGLATEVLIEQEAQRQKEVIAEANMKIATSTVNLLSQLAGKNKALQRAGIVASAGIGIYSVIKDTQAANMAAIAPPPLGLGPIAGIGLQTKNTIQGALSVASITAASAKALASVGAGGSVSGGNVGGGGGAAPQAPSFNLVQGTGRNQLAESIGQQAPVKAFVVARDMSTGQEMDRNIIKSASL